MGLEELGRALGESIKTASARVFREIGAKNPFDDLTFSHPREEAATHAVGPAIDYAGFKKLLADASITRRYPHTTPQQIDLGPLHPYIEKIWGYTARSGKEYGRAAVLNVVSGELKLGISRPGTDSECMTHISLPMDGLHFAVFDMHTHPYDPNPFARQKTRLHFSVEDIVSSISNQQLVGSFVISGEEVALLLKTSSVQREADGAAVRRHLEGLLSEMRGRRRGYSDQTWDFTRYAALELGYSLYRNSAAKRDLLQKVPVQEL